MSETICPFCTTPAAAGAKKCNVCDGALDGSVPNDFLHEDTVEAEMDLPNVVDFGSNPSGERYGGDDVILGDIGDDFETVRTGLTEELEGALRSSISGSGDDLEEPTPSDLEISEDDFLTAKTTARRRFVMPVNLHVGRKSGEMMQDAAVLEHAPGVDPNTLSPFERVVFDHIDGARPVARIAKLTSLRLEDLRIALALLVERKMITLKGMATDAAAPADASILDIELTPVGGVERPAITPVPPLPRTDSAKLPGQSAVNSAPDLTIAVDDDEPDVAPALQPGPAPQTFQIPVTNSQREFKPKDVKLYEQAREAENLGNHDEALDLLEQAAKINPRAAAIHNRIGVLLATRKHDIRGATQALSRAIDLDPNNPVYRNNLMKIAASEPKDAGKATGIIGKLFKR